MFRTAFTSTNIRVALLSSSRRAVHSSPVAGKTTKEKVVEVADKVRSLAYIIVIGFHNAGSSQVNKSVGRGLASAIETGEHVTEVTKETLGMSRQ